jgi:Fe-S-cluster-containing hydrogenase component 2
MLEMLRNVLVTLQKNKAFKEQLDNKYRERALGQHLRSVPILKDYVDDRIIDQLRYRVELVDFDPGDTIVKQGDPSDAFYLIRVGSVKVSQTHPGGEIVLTYLGRGDYFGEIGLLKNTPRNATCTALDHVEVVKIKKQDFDFILSTYEELHTKLLASAEQRLKVARHVSEHAPAVPLDDFLGQGLMGAQSLLLLDLEKCTRCDECVRACADSHQGVTRLVREGLRFDKFLVPTSCRSCMDPVCMIGCPVGSIRRKDSMEIIIEDWCIGCELCAKQCPYGNISMHPFDVAVPDPDKPGHKKAEVKDKAVTCDLCTDLKEPSCVYACPHDAAHRVDARSFFVSELTAAKDPILK